MSEQNSRDPRFSAMHSAFRECFRSETPFHQDRALVSELSLELPPVFEALLETDVNDAGVEHEAAALVTLLSRRAATLGATPTAAAALLRGLFAALRAAQRAPVDRVQRDLTSLVFEGYTAGCEERGRQALHRALAEAHTLLELAPRVFLLRFISALDPALLAAALEEVERELLRRDAQVLVNELSDLREASEEQVRAVMGLVETARSLGVRVILANGSAAFFAQLIALRIDASDVTRHEGFSFAVGEALHLAGYEIKPRRRWSRPFFRKAGLRERRSR